MKYTINDLDKKINENETLFEFIQNSLIELYDDHISREDIETMTDKQLNMIVEELDYLW